MNNTLEIKEYSLKTKIGKRVSHLGESARSGSTGGPSYDVMVHGLLKLEIQSSDFFRHGLHCKPVLWIASNSCGLPPSLFEDSSDLWFFPAASFANPSKSHILHWDPGDLIHCLDPEFLPIWEGPQTPCSPRCHRLVSLSHLKGRAGLQLVVFQFPQGVWTWALALWPGRIELFGPRDGDRNTMSSITWPVDQSCLVGLPSSPE